MRRDETARPTGEQMLAKLQTQQRARLRIYIGAAPGVGKTYSMIEDAHAFRREGVDVVIGFVETHGRAETEAKIARPRDRPAPEDRVPGRRARRDGCRRDPRPQATALHRRRARAHQCAWQPPREALSGRAGHARRGHQRDDGGEHPASRNAERCRRPRDRRARARDGARHLPRSRGRSRQRRRDRRRSSSTRLRQGRSTSRRRSSRRSRTSSAKRTCPPCASWRCEPSRTRWARRRPRIVSARGWSLRSFPSA